MKATHAMAQSHARVEASMAKLSTGSRINSAKDDAAGLAMSDRLTTKIGSTAVAINNAGDAINMVTTADAAVSYLIDIVQRGRELVVLASNGTLSAEDKSYIGLELNQLKAQFANICESTSFNGKRLFGDKQQSCESSGQATTCIVGTDTSHEISTDFTKVSTDLFRGGLIPEFVTPLRFIDGENSVSVGSAAQVYSSATGIVFTDLDGDGVEDLAFSVTDPLGQHVKILRGSGDGTYTSVSGKSGVYDFTIDGMGGGLASADVNGDGFSDLLYVNGSEIKATLNNGTGSFSGNTTSFARRTARFSSGRLGKFNGSRAILTLTCF
jgi:flagellin-like hook-associated protein FlgL